MEIKWTIFITFWKCIVSIKRFLYRVLKSFPKYYLGFIVLILIITDYVWTWRSVRNEFSEFVPPTYHKKIYPELGCQFPEVKPFSKIAMKHIRDLPKVVCHGEDWVECNMSECRVTQHILDTTNDIVCYYKDIIYISDHVYVVADPVKLDGEAVYKLNSSDGIKVSCTGYEKAWFNILTKRWFGYKAGIRPLERTPESNNTINILIVGFDSTSHNGFIRKMPKSYKYLENEMDAVILKGYNIVGDGTPDALFPILSGKTEQQHPSARKEYSKNIFLDSDDFIFHKAKLNGYETAYLEDMPSIGSFQYRYNGFNRKPADHYLRSFLMEETKSGNKWWNGIKSRYCIGSTPQYLFLLNFTRQFMNIKTKRFCFTFIADISHDDFNLISTADEDLVDFLEHVKLKLLEDTMVIVMGDHGPRYTPLRDTYQGKMEERLAFMSIILPERLKRQRPEALYFLKINADILTTPFDIHTTMLDAMGLEKYASDYVVKNAEMKRGLSLFKSIPVSRSCASAGVLPHWCTCMSALWKDVPHDSHTYGGAADALVKFINNITQEKRELCAVRKLISIEWVVSQEIKDLSANNVIYYQTLVIMSPGRAAFESTMQYDYKKDRFIILETDISRISPYNKVIKKIQNQEKVWSNKRQYNSYYGPTYKRFPEKYRYGNEPACVSDTHPRLNKYCYCKSMFRLF